MSNIGMFGFPSGAAVGALTAPAVVTRATDFTTSLPLPQTLLSGTIVPTSPSVCVEVQSQGAVSGFANCNLGIVIGIPSTPGGPLRTTGQYWPLIAGATYTPIGKAGLGDPATNCSRRFWLTGLTPGLTYTWKLETVIVGGYTSVSFAPDVPSYVCLSNDQKRAYAVSYSNGRAYEILIGGRPGWAYNMEAWGLVRGWTSTLGASLAGMGCTTTTERLVTTQFDVGGSRTIVLDAVNGSVLFTTTCPTNATQPYAVAVYSDTVAWISCASGYIFQFNPSTGANVGAAVLVDASGCRGILISPDGATVFTACGNGKIAKYPTAGGSVTAVASGSSVAWNLAWGGDRIWMSTDTAKAVRSHNLTTLAVIDTIDYSARGLPAYIATSADWKILSVMTGAAAWEYWSTDKAGADYPALALFDNPVIGTAGSAILHTSDTYILALADSTMHYWPGSVYYCRVQGGDGVGGITALFYNEFAEVAFTGAS